MICKNCKKDLDNTAFYFRKDTNKYHTSCKICMREETKYRKKAGLIKHRTIFDFKCVKCDVQKTDNDYYLKDKHTGRYDTVCKECRKVDAIQWHQDNRVQSCMNKQKWFQYNKNRMRLYYNNRLQTDSNFKLSKNLRGGTYRIVTNGCKKKCKSLQLLGCPVENCRIWLQSQFDDTMSWDNHGSYWHIDHFIPIDYFDLTESEQQHKCFHWSNLQPLHKLDNLSKGSNIPSEQEQEYHYIKVNKFLYQQVVKSIPPTVKGSTVG